MCKELRGMLDILKKKWQKYFGMIFCVSSVIEVASASSHLAFVDYPL